MAHKGKFVNINFDPSSEKKKKKSTYFTITVGDAVIPYSHSRHYKYKMGKKQHRTYSVKWTPWWIRLARKGKWGWEARRLTPLVLNGGPSTRFSLFVICSRSYATPVYATLSSRAITQPVEASRRRRSTSLRSFLSLARIARREREIKRQATGKGREEKIADSRDVSKAF